MSAKERGPSELSTVLQSAGSRVSGLHVAATGRLEVLTDAGIGEYLNNFGRERHERKLAAQRDGMSATVHGGVQSALDGDTARDSKNK